MTRDTLSILKSREVIAINQDPLGVAGDLVWKQGPQEVSLRPTYDLCSIYALWDCTYHCVSCLWSQQAAARSQGLHKSHALHVRITCS